MSSGFIQALFTSSGGYQFALTLFAVAIQGGGKLAQDQVLQKRFGE